MRTAIKPQGGTSFHPWREAIKTAEQAAISPISCIAVALADQRGRLELPNTMNIWLQEALKPSGISLFAITPEIAYQAVNTPKHGSWLNIAENERSAQTYHCLNRCIPAPNLYQFFHGYTDWLIAIDLVYRSPASAIDKSPQL